jgi:hypothetical protein
MTDEIAELAARWMKLGYDMAQEERVMSLAGRLHTIRDQLRTGRFGQREVWEEWLTEAAAELEKIERLEAQVERCLGRAHEQYRDGVAVERERMVAFIRKYCDDINATGDWPPSYVADQLITAIRKGE